MRALPAQVSDAVVAPTSPRLARAYCGPAHGQCWTVGEGDSPPFAVVLDVAQQRVSYRLVHHPRTRHPARDHQGHYLYMPVLNSPVRGVAAQVGGPPA